MALARIFDKTLRGNWYLLYVADLIVWFAIGYLCAGGKLL